MNTNTDTDIYTDVTNRNTVIVNPLNTHNLNENYENNENNDDNDDNNTWKTTDDLIANHNNNITINEDYNKYYSPEQSISSSFTSSIHDYFYLTDDNNNTPFYYCIHSPMMYVSIISIIITSTIAFCIFHYF
jgi:hypothetical protein